MSGLFPITVLILTAGVAKLSVSTLNRFFARKLSKRSVVAGHVSNVALIVAYPLLLAAGPGSRELRLLIGGHSPPLPVGIGLLVAAGLLGVSVLIWAAVEYQIYTPPACQTASESHRIDPRPSAAGVSWRRTFVGPGPMRRIALLPGNEQFTIEVSTQTYSLPRLPFAWEGLSLVQLSDLHFRGAVTRHYFESVCEQASALQPDLFVFTGDLLDDMRLLEWLPTTLGKMTAPLGCYFILGNHDWYLDPPAIRRELGRLGWIDISSRCVSLNRRDAPPIVLCGDETPWMGTHPDLDSFSADLFRILLSHTPDNITWARAQQVDVMLAGHTHGGQIRLPLLGPVYSPSRFGCRYSAGDFWLAPTLLHVSRGLSGREPIRYNCPPELSKLIFQRDTH